MPLEKQVVSLTLDKGMDTKTDSKQQVPGSLELLENGRFTEPGKIQKRPGSTGLGQGIVGSSSSISSGTGTTAFLDELLIDSGTELYSYSDGNDAWSDKGPLFNIALDASNVIKNTYQQTSQDSCYHSSGLQCFVWEDSSGGSRYSIIDYATKLQLVTNRIIVSDATKPKCYALGNYIVILYHDTSESHLKKMAIPVATPTATGIISDLVSDPVNNVYDAQVISERLFFTYNNTGGALSTGYLNAFLSISSIKTIAANVATCVAVFGDSVGRVWIAMWNGTVTRYAIYDYSLNVVHAIATIETIANVKNITGVVIGTTATIFYDITAALPYNYNIRKVTVTVSGTVGTPAVFIRSLSLGSKAFSYNSIAYVIGSYASTYQPTYFLLNGSAQVVSKLAPLSGGGIAAKVVIPQVNAIDRDSFQIAYLQKNTTTAVEGVIVSQSGIMQMTIDFDNTGLISSELASNLHLGGGFMSMYDSATLTEHGFHIFPEVPTLAQSATGSIANGVYQYVVVYEWMDNFGNIHRSAPSIPATITTTGSNGTVTVTIPTLRVTSKSDVSLVVYRTEAAGTVFYRVSSLISPTFNSTTADTVNFVDTSADASIIGNNQLYTTGGEVENISVPATEIFFNFKNRIIAVPTENRSQWWYSKAVVPGFPVEFSDLFVNNMDQYGGEMRAGGVLDDKIVFFKENTKFYVYGSGPAPSGANNDFSNPERITGDTGCINQRSIVSTPAGLMYQSPKGIYLLERSLVDKYIGSPVESITQVSNATSATLMADVNQVRFTMDNGQSIVYDYFVNQWSIDTGLRAEDATLWRGTTYAMVRSDGQVIIEDASVFTDVGRFIRLKLKTSWISFAKVQGFKRVWKMLILGEYISPHQLIVSIAQNFIDPPFQQTYINGDLSTGVYGESTPYGADDVYGGDWPLYQFRLFLSRQKCESIQITIEDAQEAAEYGRGYSISNLAFEVGVKKGADKLPAAVSYG